MIFFIACSLALDAFAVALSCGTQPRFGMKDTLLLAGLFGGFQFGMPLIGYFFGQELSGIFSLYGHWVAFVLLAWIGAKMVYDSLSSGSKGTPPQVALSPFRLLTLAFATSIDAFAVGVSMAMVPGFSLLPSCLVIGVVAFAFTLVGGRMGQRLGRLFQQRATLLGGVVLIVIGGNLLAKHLV